MVAEEAAEGGVLPVRVYTADKAIGGVAVIAKLK